MMYILILEDEIPAKKKLVKYLTSFFGESITLDSVRTVEAGRNLLKGNTSYDLILSDIKLLDGNSFEIFDEVKTKAPIVFCTAYDEHLLEAFQTNGIAYVLKPYQENELHAALRKFEKFFLTPRPDTEIYKQFQEIIQNKSKRFKKRFAIKKADGIKLLETDQISLIQAQGDFCKVIDANSQLHSISSSIGQIVSELNPNYFFKINRSQIINIEHIEKIIPYSKNRLALRIRGVGEHAVTSTSVTKEFRVWLER